MRMMEKKKKKKSEKEIKIKIIIINITLLPTEINFIIQTVALFMHL